MERTIEVRTPRGVIPVTYGPVRTIDVREHTFRDDVAQAELRQIVTRHYPSARPYSSLIDPLFSLEEFDFESTDYENERVCWINIPLGKTKQDVEKQLKTVPDATIYRILADKVEMVLSEEQLFALKSDDFDYSLDQAKRSHLVMLVQESGIPCPVSATGVWLENSVELDENGKVTAILDESGLQYASKGFSLSFKEDVDLRANVQPVKAEPAQEATSAGGVIDEAKVEAGG
jgi:hypothetical protein